LSEQLPIFHSSNGTLRAWPGL